MPNVTVNRVPSPVHTAYATPIGSVFIACDSRNNSELYSELLNVKFKWVSTEEYLIATNNFNYYALIYDRLFDRNIDNSKILKATGLKSSDFLPIKEGLKIELELLNNSDKE